MVAMTHGLKKWAGQPSAVDPFHVEKFKKGQSESSTFEAQNCVINLKFYVIFWHCTDRYYFSHTIYHIKDFLLYSVVWLVHDVADPKRVETSVVCTFNLLAVICNIPNWPQSTSSKHLKTA